MNFPAPLDQMIVCSVLELLYIFTIVILHCIVLSLLFSKYQLIENKLNVNIVSGLRTSMDTLRLDVLRSSVWCRIIQCSWTYTFKIRPSCYPGISPCCCLQNSLQDQQYLGCHDMFFLLHCVGCLVFGHLFFCWGRAVGGGL